MTEEHPADIAWREFQKDERYPMLAFLTHEQAYEIVFKAGISAGLSFMTEIVKEELGQ